MIYYGKFVSDFIQIESLRVKAEKERLNEYKTAIETSGKLYYEIIFMMIKKNLPKSECLCIFADYVKSIIERGMIFENNHIVYALRKIGCDKMTKNEIM